jgi:hypothetical protein
MAIAKKVRRKAAAAPGKKAARVGRSRSPKAGADDDEPGRSSSMGLDVDAEVLEFIAAIERFKKAHNRPFPGWSEVLFVLKELGYRKV